MWWLLQLADHAHHEPPAAAPGASVTAGWARLWYAPGSAGLLRLDHPGCHLLVLGTSTASRRDIEDIARRVAADDVRAVARVGGSCVVVVVKPDDVYVTGDLAGQRVAFYTCSPEVVVGSHSGDVARAHGRRSDFGWLATRMVLPSASEVWWTGSPWRGVSAVRPGWTLRLTRTGHISTHPPDALTQEANLEQAGAALRGALADGIRARMATARRPTVDLSGGLDSSTVAALAATMSAPLPAITLTVPGVEDAVLAAEVAAAVPALAHQEWPVPESVLPYSDLDVPELDEPVDLTLSWAWLRWWMGRIAELGSDLHLSGDGGDAVLMASPVYLADLARLGRMRELWRHASGWARLRHQAPHVLVRAAFAARHRYRQTARQVAARLEAGMPSPAGWSGLISRLEHSAVAEWLTPEVRRLVAGRLAQHVEEYTEPAGMGVGDEAAMRSLHGFARGQRLYSDLAAMCGVNHHAPYLDDGVVRACWSVPAWVRTTPTELKPLLQHVGDLVPECLTARGTKGDYTGLSYRGLRRNADGLRDLFTRSRLADAGVITDGPVRAVIDRAAAGVPIQLGAFDLLVATEIWLRAQTTPAPERTGHDSS